MRLVELVGPRTPPAAWRTGRYAAPALALGVAALLLFASTFLPVWHMKLIAPQYPKGLVVTAYMDRLGGDVGEIDELNHYIGMRPLDQAARFERGVAVISVISMGLLLWSAIAVHTKYAALLSFPALSFPVVFLLDLQYWLRDSGLNLDPHAALSSSIKPFVPPVLGAGFVGQFKTVAWVGPGFVLQVVASCLIVLGLYLHRRAYKPLLEAALSPAASSPAQATSERPS